MPETLTPNDPEDLMDQALAIAAGKSQITPTRQHLLVLALQCEIHIEDAQRAKAELNAALETLTQLARSLAEPSMSTTRKCAPRAKAVN